jgi:Zn-dependent protease with chaperone function
MSQFALLCLLVCFASAALLAVAGTILAQVSWTSLRWTGLDRRILHRPFLLFLVRTLPLSLPAAVILLAVLPSFVKLEPRQTAEKPEWWLIGLAALSVTGVGIVLLRMAMILARTWQMRRTFLRCARRLDANAPIPTYVVAAPDCMVAVVGIVRPRLFIGRRVLDCLSREELQAAIAHEIAHVQAFDNLKQVLLRSMRIPHLFIESDRALRDAAEIAADRCALRGQISPLNLGAAIIKVARLNASPVLTAIAASHLVPEFESSALRMRVEHIHSALEEKSLDNEKGATYCGVAALALLILYFAMLPFWLDITHRVTELLVR